MKRTRPRYPQPMLELSPSNPKTPPKSKSEGTIRPVRLNTDRSFLIPLYRTRAPKVARNGWEPDWRIPELPGSPHPRAPARPHRAIFCFSRSARWISRWASRFAAASRLSYCFLPFARPISSFA